MLNTRALIAVVMERRCDATRVTTSGGRHTGNQKGKQTQKERSAWSTSTGVTNQPASGERRRYLRHGAAPTARTRPPPPRNPTSEALLLSSVPTRVRGENNKSFSPV
ncbi:hypothetical protein EYF80_032103 [Liparis tanakae]|uniref:Uncharacterized protein n=1 Tax=Liparis tanakae TaxID=230148 RepID=A0A4Z2GWH8_9TELE|nr:hypothetical protein EYF80_032103 [Liparis tanakae]